jgi:hypothetical protein
MAHNWKLEDAGGEEEEGQGPEKAMLMLELSHL